MDSNIMPIEEMKRTKNGWQVWEKIFSKRHNKLVNMERTIETQWEIMSLITVYSFCLTKTKQIIELYSDLIDKAEINDVSEKYFRSKIYEAKRIHKAMQNELEKPENKRLADKYINERANQNEVGI